MMALPDGCSMLPFQTQQQSRITIAAAAAFDAHAQSVMKMVRMELAWICPACVPVLWTRDECAASREEENDDNDDKGSNSAWWNPDAADAVVRMQYIVAAIALNLLYDHTLSQENLLAAQRLEFCKNEGCESAGHDAGTTLVLSTSIRQVYVSTWAAACFLGMVCIACIFIVQRAVDEAATSSVRISPSAAAAYPSSMIGKSDAMLLCFAYAGMAWAMSNGILLNPRPVIDTGGAGCN